MEDQGDVTDQAAGKLSSSNAQCSRNRCANDDPIMGTQSQSRQNSSGMLNMMDASSFSMPPPNLHSSKVINPNKAIFTIDANTGQIFIVNNKACQLLGYTSQELRNKGFFDLLNGKTESHISSLAEMQIEGDEGRVVLLSGKVIEMKTKSGGKILVSLWIRQISTDGRHIAVAEPVERHICHISTDRSGVITSVDSTTATIFFYESIESVVGVSIVTLIPFIKLPDPDSREIPKSLRKQRATGRTTDNVKFPLCLLIALDEDASAGYSHSGKTGLNITVWVFQNLSGLIVVDDIGNILMCNQPFSLLMFGYGQDKIMNMHISAILPNFGKDSREEKSPNVSNTSITSNDWEPDTDPFVVDNDSSLQSCKKSSANRTAPNNEQSSVGDAHLSCNLENSSGLFCDLRQPDDCTIDDILTPVNASNSFPADEFEAGSQSQVNEASLDKAKSASTETCDASGSNPATRLLSSINGSFVGEAIHADGSVIEVVYSVLLQILPCTNRVYCIWVCRNPSTRLDGEKYNYANLTSTFNSMASTVEQSLGQVIKTTAAQNSSRPNSLSLVSKYEDELYLGDYSKYYTSIRQIGRGAYGYVNMAFRNTDRLLVITKFILKEKLCSQFMVKSRDCKEVPIEIHLLQTLNHKNIVSVLDVFENDLFYQLVMEKHGSGMDLWTFIERRPLMDEKLGSYIFRQVADAVNYLHEQKILHRDIKDENIIIDQNFTIKLIDFGSATFMEEGKFFSTFYGTTEYCSPEVLAGNRYVGPELEIWALGVTLYVLMFFENPFIDVEETLKAEIQIPKAVSEQLSRLLSSMLNKDPKYRCTMHQLITDPWLTQEVNPSTFSFSWIVPCKAHEANPDLYFSGYLYSSTSVLSTISPQESFSHIEEASIGGSDDARLASHRTGNKLCVNEAKHNKMDTLYAKQFQLNTSVSNHELRVSLPDSSHPEIGGSICSSKSENDIFKNKLQPCVSTYNVVSLHDVSTKPKMMDLK
ncbi:PAS domain-containing serine/threonine-protein kinase isoform X1 [Drosophila mauritiana]|uniref:PAS domain-containing serine/threonine-protein kinase isoform X1 n=1 Tax=Drosophila mauritiana TaxID=7226 RepID=A0A6P8JVF7_DROMA|nr:PAS domain-containing serine/threonine-protein kinase isoform X1 [Drosophila mauritiana]